MCYLIWRNTCRSNIFLKCFVEVRYYLHPTCKSLKGYWKKHTPNSFVYGVMIHAQSLLCYSLKFPIHLQVVIKGFLSVGPWDGRASSRWDHTEGIYRSTFTSQRTSVANWLFRQKRGPQTCMQILHVVFNPLTPKDLIVNPPL